MPLGGLQSAFDSLMPQLQDLDGLSSDYGQGLACTRNAPLPVSSQQPKFFLHPWLEGGQATWSTKALVLLPWEHGSVQKLAPQPV